MRGMHFDGANPKLCEAIHFRTRIGHRPRKDSAERDKAIRGHAAIFCAPVIYFRREPDNLWRDVVDQPRALYPKTIEQPEKFFRIGAITLNIGVIPAAALHQFMGGRLHHVIRHDVNVNVYDRFQRSPPFAEACAFTRAR